MFSCCCTEETTTETIQRDSVWASATYEGSPSVTIPEASLPAAPPVHAPVVVKAPEAAYETGVDNDSLFTAILERPQGNEPLGLCLDLSDSMTLYIGRVSDSTTLPAYTYNVQVPPEKRLKEGDYILEVNGKKGRAKDLADAIRIGGKRLELKVRRPTHMQHKVKKHGQSLGLDLQFAKQGGVLSICKVLDGAVKTAGVDIAAGDRIIRVNGREAKTDELLSMMSESVEPDLTVSRCPEVFVAYAKGFCPEVAPPLPARASNNASAM